MNTKGRWESSSDCDLDTGPPTPPRPRAHCLSHTRPAVLGSPVPIPPVLLCWPPDLSPQPVPLHLHPRRPKEAFSGALEALPSPESPSPAFSSQSPSLHIRSLLHSVHHARFLCLVVDVLILFFLIMKYFRHMKMGAQHPELSVSVLFAADLLYLNMKSKISVETSFVLCPDSNPLPRGQHHSKFGFLPLPPMFFQFCYICIINPL